MTDDTPHSAGPAGETGSVLTPLNTGIILVIVGLSLASLADGFSKLLAPGLSVLMVVWGRFVFNLACVLPIALKRHGLRALLPDRLGLQITRGLLMLAATLSFIAALYGMPLADALAIAFAYPFVVTALSPVMLGETVTHRHWLAVLGGFAGVLVVIRPGFETISTHTMLALLASVCFAVHLLITRKLSTSAPAFVTITFSSFIGAAVMTVGLPFFWQPVSGDQWLLLALSGAGAAAAHVAINRAYTLAPAATLAPIGYTEIVAAAAVGYVMFGDFPDAVTWIGVAIISASGVYIAMNNPTARAGKTATTL